MKSEPLHILLADDDKADRFLFREAFSELEMKTIVHTVDNGMELMEWLNKEDTQLPHLLFLDLNMPGKNGLKCLKEIRNNEKLKDIFIAIYSTSDNEKDIEETFLHGANIYITKPGDFKLLKQVLEKAVITADQRPFFNKANFLLRL